MMGKRLPQDTIWDVVERRRLRHVRAGLSGIIDLKKNVAYLSSPSPRPTSNRRSRYGQTHAAGMAAMMGRA
jgi:hypothetical protein